MNNIWTNNPEEIMHELRFLSKQKAELDLLVSSKEPLATVLHSLEEYKGETYLVMKRPKGLNSEQIVTTVRYRIDGVQKGGFVCEIAKKSAKLMAARLPSELFFVSEE